MGEQSAADIVGTGSKLYARAASRDSWAIYRDFGSYKGFGFCSIALLSTSQQTQTQTQATAPVKRLTASACVL